MAQEGDCEWVVERCKACLSSNDRHGAKAWILTARSLFPDNFAVQYEAFSLHLCCEELKEAAKALADLCTKFPREPQLQTYIAGLIAEVVRSQGVHDGSGTVDKNKEDQVKKALFDLLPGETQKSILQQAADKSSNTLQRCRILLVALTLFPDTATTIGLDLYDILGKQPTGEYLLVADNPYRELLVNEVIPLLSGSREVCIEHAITRTNGQSVVLKTSHLCQWLESSASYYTAITAQALLHNRAHRSAGRRGWEQLHQLFVSTAEKCGWRETLTGKQIGPHLPAKIRWLGLEKISGYNSHLHLQTFEAPRNVAIACFYISVFLFFEMAWEYCSEMLYPTGGGERSASSPKPSWVLIEERFTKSQAEEKSTKRRKVDEHQAFMNIHTGSRSLDQRMVECFLAAIDCWDFLQSNSTYRGGHSQSPIVKYNPTSLPPLIKIDPYTVLVQKASLQNSNFNHSSELKSPEVESNSTHLQEASKMPSTPAEDLSHPHYRPTVINLAAPTTPMDTSPQPLVPTPDSDRPERMRDWLVRMINSGQFPGLKWLDEDKMIFRVPWIHAKKRDYNMERDAALFREWAIHSGKYGDGSDVTTWKINFRCALNGLKDIIERRELEEPDCRVYQMLPSTGIGRRRKRRRPYYPEMITYQPPERNVHPRIEFTSPATTPTATIITPTSTTNAPTPSTPIQVLPIVTAGGQIRIPFSSFTPISSPIASLANSLQQQQQQLQQTTIGIIQKNMIHPVAISTIRPQPPELRTDSPLSRDSSSQPRTPRTPVSPAQFSPKVASPPLHALSPLNNISTHAITVPSAMIPMFPALKTGPVYCPPSQYCSNPHAVSIRIMYGSITIRQETFDLKSGARIYYGPLHCRDILSKEEEEKLFGPLEAHQIALNPRHPAPLAKKLFGFMHRGLILEANDEGIYSTLLSRPVVYYGHSPLKHSGTLPKEERTRVFSYSSHFLSALKCSSEGHGAPPKPYTIFSLGQSWGAERPLSKNLVTVIVTYCKALNDLRVRNIPIHDELLFEAQEGKDIRIISPSSGDLEAEEFLNPRVDVEERTPSSD